MDKPDGYLSRKFLLAALSMVIGAGGLFSQTLDGGQFVTLLLGTVGAYIAGNVLEGRV